MGFYCRRIQRRLGRYSAYFSGRYTNYRCYWDHTCRESVISICFPCVGLQTESRDSRAEYYSFAVCTIVSRYLTCSMCFNLRHCAYVCTIYLLLVCSCNTLCCTNITIRLSPIFIPPAKLLAHMLWASSWLPKHLVLMPNSLIYSCQLQTESFSSSVFAFQNWKLMVWTASGSSSKIILHSWEQLAVWKSISAAPEHHQHPWHLL